ncbi:16711_t:CDS:2, partial [Acaulospora colombiana]
GNLFQIYGDIGEWPSKFQEKYGDMYEIYSGPQRIVWLCSEGLINKIMKPKTHSNFHDLVKSDNEGLREIGVLESGVICNINYKNWEYYRRFYARTILRHSVLSTFVHSIMEVFNEMENYWEQLGDETVLEFSKWSKRYFMDSIFFVATGKPAYSMASYYNSLSTDKKISVSESNLKESDTFLEAIDAYSMSLIYFMLFPKFIRNFPGFSGYTRKLKSRVNWLRNNIYNIIKERREEIERTPEDQELANDILTMFLTINTSRDITEKIADSLHDKPMTDEEICGNFVETMTGGSDTASNSICFLIHSLSHHPEVKEKLIEEIDRVLGKDLNYKLTYENVAKLEYCEAVINECLRLFTIAPILPKKNTNPDEIGGVKFSADTQFIINVQGIHKHKFLWENPGEFIPERFMGEAGVKSKNSFYAFGGGLRKCAGRNFAMLELKITLAMLYGKYNVELVDRDAPIKFHTTT